MAFEKVYKPIPTCKQTGCDNPLFDSPAYSYDGRRKYCKQCAIERKKRNNAFYSWKKRHFEKEIKPYRKEEVDQLKEIVNLQKEEIELLKCELTKIRLSLNTY